MINTLLLPNCSLLLDKCSSCMHDLLTPVTSWFHILENKILLVGCLSNVEAIFHIQWQSSKRAHSLWIFTDHVSGLLLYSVWKHPSQLDCFDRAIAPFHTNGNDAFCFSVTGEQLPIFRSHCQVVHICISLHTCVCGTGNGCWQHNGSMRMQYKSLIMSESWTAAVKCTYHSAATTASSGKNHWGVKTTF